MTDQDWSLRTATPSDEPGVTALLDRSYTTLMAGSYATALLQRALPRIARANPALLQSGTYHVAESSAGRIVGCGGWTPERPDSAEVEPTLGHVRHFATDPDWTGHGIGRAIHERSRDQALAAGIVRFRCYASLNAVAFYSALGFRPVRRIEVPIADEIAFPAMLMELELRPDG